VIIERLSVRLSAAALVVVVGIVVLLGPLAPAASAATPLASAEATFLSLLNGLRSTLSLGTLTIDSQLSDVARGWSVKMADSGSLSHNPSLSAQVTANWSKLAENVGNGSSATQIFNALVASAPHLRNMSDPVFSRIGIGSVTDARGQIWTTHVFMQPSGGSVPVSAPPTKAIVAPAKTPSPAAVPVPRAVPTTLAKSPAASTSAVAPATANPTPTSPPPPVSPVPVTAAPATTTPPDVATVATEPNLAPVLAVSPPARSLPVLLVAGAALLVLLALGSIGWFVRRSVV